MRAQTLPSEMNGGHAHSGAARLFTAESVGGRLEGVCRAERLAQMPLVHKSHDILPGKLQSWVRPF